MMISEPASALLLGLMRYGEIPTAFGLIGMVLVVGAIIIRTRAVSSEK